MSIAAGGIVMGTEYPGAAIAGSTREVCSHHREVIAHRRQTRRRERPLSVAYVWISLSRAELWRMQIMIRLSIR